MGTQRTFFCFCFFEAEIDVVQSTKPSTSLYSLSFVRFSGAFQAIIAKWFRHSYRLSGFHCLAVESQTIPQLLTTTSFSVSAVSDIDECLETNIQACGCTVDSAAGDVCGAKCKNYVGGYSCSCGEGYHLQHDTLCTGWYRKRFVLLIWTIKKLNR